MSQDLTKYRDGKTWPEVPYRLSGMSSEQLEKGFLYQEAWDAPSYEIRPAMDDGRSLMDLLCGGVVVQYTTQAWQWMCQRGEKERRFERLVEVMSAEDEMWRIYAVEFLEDVNYIQLHLISHDGNESLIDREWYQLSIGLYFGHIDDMAIRVIELKEDPNIPPTRKFTYKRAIDSDEPRVVLTSWNKEIGMEMITVGYQNGSKSTQYYPPQCCATYCPLIRDL